MKKHYFSSEISNSPISGAVESHGLIFLSGQIHADSEWKLHGETVEEKLKITIGNIERILKEAGLSLSDVINVRIYVTNIDDLQIINEEYKKYFSDPMPARTSVCVSSLPLGASLEIEVVASRD